MLASIAIFNRLKAVEHLRKVGNRAVRPLALLRLRYSGRAKFPRPSFNLLYMLLVILVARS